MKKFIILFMLFSFAFGNAQINVFETFDAPTLTTGWSFASDPANTNIGLTTNSPINGTRSFLFNFGLSGSGNLNTPFYTSNGAAIRVSFKTKESSSFQYAEYKLFYQISGGAYVQVGTNGGLPASTTVVTNNFSIPAGTIPSGSQVKFMLGCIRIGTNGPQLYIDDVIIDQTAAAGIVSTPVASTQQTLCGVQSLASLIVTGTNLKFYNAQIGGTLLNNSLTAQNGITYYVSQTVGSVESIRTPIIVTVNPFPAPPTASSQTFTTSSSVSNLVANGTNLKWYTTLTGGTQLAPTTTLLTGTYFVSQTVGTCESTRTAVAVISNVAPVTIAEYNFNGTLNNILGNSPFSTLTANTYVEDRSGNANGALSMADGARNATIVNLPVGNSARTVSLWLKPNITSNGLTVFIYGATSANNAFGFSFTSSTFNNFGWANDLTGNFAFAANNWYHVVCTYSAGQATVYINGNSIVTDSKPDWNTTASNFILSSINGGVDDLKIYNYALSPQQVSNLFITNTLNPATTPTFTQVAPICSGAALATLPTTSINGVTGTWAPAVNNTTTTTYTFTPTAGQGSASATMTITVNSIAAPTAAAQTLPAASTVANLVATGSNLKWYSTLTGGTQLASTTTLATGTYFVSQTVGTCESTRTSVAVTIGSTGDISFSNLTSSAITNNSATVSVTLANVCPGARFQIQYSTSSVFGANTIIAPQTTNVTNGVNTINLTGLNSGVQYFFRFFVYINDACNTSAIFSTTSSFVTTNTLISFSNLTSTAITNTIATVGVTLGNVCAGATYTLQYSTFPSFQGVINLTQSNNVVNGINSVNITNLDQNQIYYFRFYALANQACNSTDIYSATSSFTTTNVTLVTPVFTQVAPVCSGATLAALPTTSTNGITGTWAPAVNNTTTTTYTFTPTAGQGATTATMTITVNPSVTPTFAAATPICSGATLAPLPTTSTNGITGTWSPALNNMSTTTYTFTPTAGQCATTTTRVITVNPNVTPTFTQLAPICSGTTFSLPITSNNNIIGTWAPTFNNTVTTTYTFTPAAGQCASTSTMTVTVNPAVTPTFAAATPICSGATLAPLPTTSTNGITGTWSPALNNTATTTYTFTPTSGQCATTTTLVITINPSVTPTFAGTTPICSGATLAPLPTISTNAITGTWSPALNNTTTTTYTFTPTSGQCATTTTLVITINPSVTPTFAATTPICSGATLAPLPTISTNAITGTWSPALNNMATTTYTFTPTAGQCATTTTRVITVNPNVTPTFTQLAPICSGTTFSLPITSNNNIIGTWAPTFNNTVTTTYTFTPATGQCASTTTMTVTVNPAVTPTFATVASICSGATLAPLPTTSTNGITGTWLPALNNTTTTTYTFTPTSGQCASTTTMTVTVNPAVTPTFAAATPICSGATLAPLPTTSINGITGTWSPALNNTATTTYTFTPTSGQCATTTTRVITVNPSVTPTFAAATPICSGATLAPLPTTSTNGITGTWSPALNNTATTTYTFTPAAGQCATTTTRVITVNPSVTPTFTQLAPICSGTTFSLPITSNNNIIGTWAPTFSNTVTTTYTFTPATGQCANTATMTVTVNSVAIPTGAATQTFVQGATVANLVVNPSNVIWYSTNADALANTNPMPSTTLLTNGNIYYAVNTVGSCRSIAFPVTGTVTLGIENKIKVSLILYPNPVKDVLNIEMTGEVKSIEIHNIEGKKVLSTNLKQINVSKLSKGTYVIQIQDTENNISTKKFIKE